MLTLVAYDDVLDVVRRIAERCEAGGRPLTGPIVQVGGSAMAALGVRERSTDVDLYAVELDAQAVHDVEEELRPRLGSAFRIDATTTENLWGTILVRDIADSPKVGEVRTAGGVYELLAQRIEDLFLLKLSADRTRDHDDLPLLAAKTTPDELIARFNQLVAWHGDRGALPGYADAFVRELAALFGEDPAAVVPRLLVPDWIRRLLHTERS